MSDGSEIFDTYQKEYETLHEALLQKVNAIPSSAPEQRKLLSNEAERLLEEADELLSSMEVELSSLAQPIRTRLTPRLRSFKEEIKKVRRDLTKHVGQSDRDQLLGSHVVDFEVASQDQRSRLLHGTERLQESSRRMDEARRIALETEAIGINTIETLAGQREQILRTRDRLSTADTWIAKSQGVLKGMQRRMMTNKLITAGIILMLIIMIIVIIYLKWF